jgi:predicted amidohydrolase YtcJ
MGVASTAALRLAGIGHNTPVPEGGAIESRGGKLTGLLQERAQQLIKAHVPEPTETAMVEDIEAAGRDLASRGFATASDMNVGMTAGVAEIGAYRRARAEGRLMQRMWQVLAGNPEGIADQAWESGLRPDTTDDMLAWGGMKTFADGSAGGLTAAFFDPYEAAQGGGTGILCFSDADHHAMLAKYHAQGWQLDIHAIGDAAIEQVLTGMEACDTPDRPVLGRRHRIEHCGFLNAGQRRRMKARGIIPVPQPVFLYEFGDVYLKVLGKERSEACYPMRTWVDEGHNPSASSDAPVSTVNPFVNLYTMITRKTVRGTVIGADQCLSVAEAVHCYTAAGAYTQFAEARRGTLEMGQFADLAILSRDIFDAAPEDILDTKAGLTLRGGTILFDRHGEAAAAEAAQ